MKTKISLLLLALALLFGCQQTQSGEKNKIKKGMIKVAILYPNGEGKTFAVIAPAKPKAWGEHDV